MGIAHVAVPARTRFDGADPANGPTARHLTVRYVFALSLVALLSLLGQLLVQYEMVRQASDARVVNVAGRQRMLSQRLSKAALEIRSYPETADRRRSLDEFREALVLWERSHEGLQHGAPEASLPGENSSKVRALFAAGEPHFEAMRQAGWQLLALVERNSPATGGAAERISTILANEGPFLTAMDRIVVQYQHEAEGKVRTLRKIELGLLALTLAVLAAEGFLVFRPAVRRVSQTIRALTSAQGQLRRSQTELEAKVERRTADLSRSEQQFRKIFESATIGMAQVVPPDGRFVRVNPRLCQILRYSPEELLTKTFREITHPEDRERDFASFQRMVRGEIDRFEARKRYLRKDGHAVWVQVAAVLLVDANGRPERSVTIVEDVSARVEAEQALRRSEERFRTLAEAVPQIVWTANEDLRIEYFNRRWYEYTGMNAAHPSVLDLGIVVHADEREHLDAVREDARRRALPFETEHRLRAADGSYRWHLTRALPLFDEQGKLVRWFGTCTDIEGQKETQLVAERASRSKDEFVALISHELRTPLTAILGWTGLLRKSGLDRELVARATGIIERNAQTQAQLVEDLLDMSRIIKGKLEIARRPIVVASAMTAAMDVVRPAAEGKRVRVDFVHSGGTALVLGDARRLQQVFWNLLSNAIKFTPEDGHVEVRVEVTDHARVSVSDDGQGIDPAFLPYVFDRFRQAHEDSARSHGLGLGLAIARQIVELHGGTIVAHSEGTGRGACFVVELPLASEGSKIADASPSASVPSVPSVH